MRMLSYGASAYMYVCRNRVDDLPFAYTNMYVSYVVGAPTTNQQQNIG